MGRPLLCHATSGAALPEAVTGLMSATNESVPGRQPTSTRQRPTGIAPAWLEDAAVKTEERVNWLSNEAYQLARVVGRAQ